MLVTPKGKMVNPQEDSLKRETQAIEKFDQPIEYGGQN